MSNPFELRHPSGLHIAPGLRESTLLDAYPALVVQPRSTILLESGTA